MQQGKTTSYERPPSLTFVIQVVAPFVWPAPRRAVILTLPSEIESPSLIWRVAVTGGKWKAGTSP